MTIFNTTKLKERIAQVLVVVLMLATFGMMLVRPVPVQAQGVAGGLAQVSGAIAACKLDDLVGSVMDSIGGLFGFDLGGGEDTVPVDDLINNDRECITDGLFKAFANWVLQELTHSIVTWILNGFEGRPAFVTDLKQFFLDAADRAIGEYIYGSELSALCSPFEFDVRLALALQYQDYTRNPVECTLTDVRDNIDDFFAGDFASGGFARWFEMTASPQNTPHGALLVAQNELEARIADEEFRKDLEIRLGEGFLNYEKCEEVDPADHPGRAFEEGEQYCYTTTPGQTISDMLSFQLETGTLQLIEADEINESISAIVAALAYKALETGLSGLNDDGYLDSFREQSPTGIERGAGSGDGSSSGGGGSSSDERGGSSSGTTNCGSRDRIVYGSGSIHHINTCATGSFGSAVVLSEGVRASSVTVNGVSYSRHGNLDKGREVWHSNGQKGLSGAINVTERNGKSSSYNIVPKGQ